MNKKLKRRIIFDSLMTILLFVQMSYFYTGQGLHEWVGLVLFALFIIHHIMNHKWISGIFKGHWNAMRCLRFTTNLLMLITITGLILSGISMSMVAVPSLSIGINGSLARRIHMVASYISYLLMSFHIGLHWGMISGLKASQYGLGKLGHNKLLQASGTLIALYGLYALIKQDLLSYILLRTAYVYFDYSQSLIRFLLDYIAIMGLFLYIGHYTSKGLRNHHAKY